MREILALGFAGAAGAIGRYAVSGWAYRLLGDRFAYGTLIVNVLGSLLLAFIMQIALSSDMIPQQWRLPITVGFFGAFTTFSTFSYETVRYIEDGAWTLATTNVVANVFLCVAATLLGLAAGRVVVGGA